MQNHIEEKEEQKMKRGWPLFLLTIIVLLCGAGLMAEESAMVKVTITDGNSGLLRCWFEEVAIFTFDPVNGTLGKVAVATFKDPNDSLQLLLAPGHYQIMVKVKFVPHYVPFGRVEVLKGQKKVVFDLRTVKIPDELITY